MGVADAHLFSEILYNDLLTRIDFAAQDETLDLLISLLGKNVATVILLTLRKPLRCSL